MILKNSLLFLIVLLFTASLFAQKRYIPLKDRLGNNLYITVSVNKSECYVGEPIIATYKLYSALESASSILRNPSFYGFSYKDIITQRDGIAGKETIDGKIFEVHTVKKVQLTPNEPGSLELDALTMANKIRVLDDNGRKIDLLNGVLEDYRLDGDYIHFTISSVPIAITVLKPVNTGNPIQYSGATGDFWMNIKIDKSILAPGETGLLTITISGSGDLSKVKQPAVSWPTGIITYPAKVQTNSHSAINGYKVFGIPFSGSAEGNYTIPPIQFSYFDTLNNRLNTITNKPVIFDIYKEKDEAIIYTESYEYTKGIPLWSVLIFATGILLALLLLLIFIRKRKKEQVANNSIPNKKNEQKTTVPTDHKDNPLDKYLQPAADTRHHSGNAFYTFLKQGMVRFFEDRFALPAFLFNSTSLQQSLRDNEVKDAIQKDILNLLTEIEMHIYSGGGLDTDKTALLEKTKKVLSKL
ncbi:MAG: BatD family protein [Niabella sp.]